MAKKKVVLYTRHRIPDRIEGTLSADGKYIRYGYRQMRTAKGLVTWDALSAEQ